MYTGSIFRKWDLHVHTPSPFEHQYRFDIGENEKFVNDIWEKYISKLEHITEICALGITDYFNIDGYKKVYEYKNAKRLQNISLILPNIEFRLDKFVGNEVDPIVRTVMKLN